MTRPPMTPFAMAIAPTGARKQKSDHPALPITPAEVAYEAAACVEAGATLLHLHVRDEDNRHSLDVARYRAAIAAVRQAVGDRIIIQATSEAVGIYTPAQQRAMVRALKPEAVSLAPRELIPDTTHETEAAEFYRWLAHERIAAQHILYSADDVIGFMALLERGIIVDPRPHALFVLGRYTVGQVSSPADVLAFMAVWPSDFPWSVCAFGTREAASLTAAMALGGHARVGFENNHFLPTGEKAPHNAAQVENLAHIAGRIARPVASIAEARLIYGVV